MDRIRNFLASKGKARQAEQSFCRLAQQLIACNVPTDHLGPLLTAILGQLRSFVVSATPERQRQRENSTMFLLVIWDFVLAKIDEARQAATKSICRTLLAELLLRPDWAVCRDAPQQQRYRQLLTQTYEYACTSFVLAVGAPEGGGHARGGSGRQQLGAMREAKRGGGTGQGRAGQAGGGGGGGGGGNGGGCNSSLAGGGTRRPEVVEWCALIFAVAFMRAPPVQAAVRGIVNTRLGSVAEAMVRVRERGQSAGARTAAAAALPPAPPRSHGHGGHGGRKGRARGGGSGAAAAVRYRHVLPRRRTHRIPYAAADPMGFLRMMRFETRNADMEKASLFVDGNASLFRWTQCRPPFAAGRKDEDLVFEDAAAAAALAAAEAAAAEEEARAEGAGVGAEAWSVRAATGGGGGGGGGGEGAAAGGRAHSATGGGGRRRRAWLRHLASDAEFYSLFVGTLSAHVVAMVEQQEAVAGASALQMQQAGGKDGAGGKSGKRRGSGARASEKAAAAAGEGGKSGGGPQAIIWTAVPGYMQMLSVMCTALQEACLRKWQDSIAPASRVAASPYVDDGSALAVPRLVAAAASDGGGGGSGEGGGGGEGGGQQGGALAFPSLEQWQLDEALLNANCVFPQFGRRGVDCVLRASTAILQHNPTLLNPFLLAALRATNVHSTHSIGFCLLRLEQWFSVTVTRTDLVCAWLESQRRSPAEGRLDAAAAAARLRREAHWRCAMRQQGKQGAAGRSRPGAGSDGAVLLGGGMGGGMAHGMPHSSAGGGGINALHMGCGVLTRELLPRFFNPTELVRSLGAMLCSEHHDVLKKALAFIFRTLHHFPPKPRREVTALLLARHSQLFLSWSSEVRSHYHHIIVYKTIATNRLLLLGGEVDVHIDRLVRSAHRQTAATPPPPCPSRAAFVRAY
jgi:hypothetical protein